MTSCRERRSLHHCRNMQKRSIAGNMAPSTRSSRTAIEALMVRKAKEGKQVVRLKGGDPFLFGRGGEELEVLRDEGIEVELVPGISSALAVPGAVGIPLTHRKYRILGHDHHRA